MRMLRACLDRRVLVALAAITVGVYVIAPEMIGRAMPLLLVAACPLSMLVMAASMRPASDEPPLRATRTERDSERLERRFVELDREPDTDSSHLVAQRFQEAEQRRPKAAPSGRS